MKSLAMVLGVGLLAATACGETVVQELRWDVSEAVDLPQGARILTPAEGRPFASMEVSSASTDGLSVTLATVDAPGIGSPVYGIRGQVACTGVDGHAYVEMWSHFPGGEVYFSRTLAETGPMGYLAGDSDWRPVVLPFSVTDSGKQPQRLVINVVLPGRGTVLIGPLEIVEFEALEDAFAAPGQWWEQRMGGIIGGLLGTAMGLWGVAIGILLAKGRARGVVSALLTAMTAIGVICLAAGLWALIRHQPYAVWYPFLLCGVLATVLSVTLRPVIRRRYEQLELRRLQAQDL